MVYGPESGKGKNNQGTYGVATIMSQINCPAIQANADGVIFQYLNTL